MSRIVFTSVTFRQLTRREIFDIAVENGITQIEWGADVHLQPQDDIALEEVTRLQRELGVSACSYGSYYRLGANDMDAWRAVTQTSEAIGAKTVRIWAGSRPSAETDETAFSALVAEAQTLAEIAAERGLTITFEFHKGTYNDTGASSVKLLKSIDRSNVKTYWQPMSIPEDEGNLQAVLPFLAGVHVFHWSKSGRRFSLKFGRRNWERFIRMIARGGADVPFILEFVKGDSRKQFARDVKTLRELLGGVYGE